MHRELIVIGHQFQQYGRQGGMTGQRPRHAIPLQVHTRMGWSSSGVGNNQFPQGQSAGQGQKGNVVLQLKRGTMLHW